MPCDKRWCCSRSTSLQRHAIARVHCRVPQTSPAVVGVWGWAGPTGGLSVSRPRLDWVPPEGVESTVPQAQPPFHRVTRQPENCSAGVGLTWTPAEGGGLVGEMGFRVGPFVLCKNGCWRQRHRNTKFGPKKFFPPIIFPPHLSSQNDQRDVGIILSHRCWVDPPPPLPARRPRREGGGLGKWASVSPPPPRRAIFFTPKAKALLGTAGQQRGVPAARRRPLGLMSLGARGPARHQRI